MRKIHLFIMIPIIFLYGCGSKYEIHPHELSIAYVGKPYSQILTISGGKVIDKNFILETNFPEDMGFTIQPINDLDGYNIIEVKGVPKYSGEYTIKIKADFFGGGGAEINKTYLLTVQ